MGKLHLMLEPLIPPRPAGTDESLADFATRRLGREAFERLVQPLVSGIYPQTREVSVHRHCRRWFRWNVSTAASTKRCEPA